MSNNLSDFSKQSYRSKTCNISQNSSNRESFLANCCPICPVFEGSKIRNLLGENYLINVRSLEVDKVISWASSAPLYRLYSTTQHWFSQHFYILPDNPYEQR